METFFLRNLILNINVRNISLFIQFVSFPKIQGGRCLVSSSSWHHGIKHSCERMVYTVDTFPVQHKNWKKKKKHANNYKLNLGCLHPVARVISYDMGFNPSTQL
jgi:hypothetical protein